MIEVITANRFKIYYSCEKDPDIPQVEHYARGWKRRAFAATFGITIPEIVTHISIEEHRGIFGKTIGFDQSQRFKNPEDDELLAAIWHQRALMRKYAQEEAFSGLAPPFTSIVYNKSTGQFDTIVDPDIIHHHAVDDMSRHGVKFGKHFLELMEVLKAKGIVVPADFSDDLKSDLLKLKAKRDQINWQKWIEDSEVI